MKPIKILIAIFFIKSSLVMASAVEIPWQQEITNTSSGYTDHEAAGKVRYYLRQELKDWEGLCKVGGGNFHSDFSKISCEMFYPEWWECTGTATAYCDL